MLNKRFRVTCRVIKRASGRTFQPKTSHDVSADNETAAHAEVRKKQQYVTRGRDVEVVILSCVER
jgi:hypothetical protein